MPGLVGTAKRIIGGLTASMALSIGILPAVALEMPTGEASPDYLIRKIPIHTESYLDTGTLVQQTQTPETTLQLINQYKSNLLVHMESIRQAYHHFGTNKPLRDKFMASMKSRYTKNTADSVAFFDYGYAQVMFDGNKNGLFFLRKANDALVSPASNLAYGLAQIDADRYFENASPMLMTTRKMDVVYKLKDALTLNKVQKMAGIWPTFVEIRNSLRPYDAYESMLKEDFTLMYVPKGSTELTARGFQLFTNPRIEEAVDPSKKQKIRRVKSDQPFGATMTELPRVEALPPDTTPANQRPAPVRTSNFFTRMLGLDPESAAPKESSVVKVESLSQVVAVPNFTRPFDTNTIANANPLPRVTEEPVPNYLMAALSPTTQPAAPTALPYGLPEGMQPVHNVFVSLAGDTAAVNKGPNTYVSNSPTSSTGLTTTPVTVGATSYPGSDTCQVQSQVVNPKEMRFAVVMNLMTQQAPPNAIEFYNSNPETSPYYVRILDISKRVIGQLYSSKAPFIMEDLDRDGTYEMVVRQYNIEPMQPILVYRWNGSCYGEDRDISAYFQ